MTEQTREPLGRFTHMDERDISVERLCSDSIEQLYILLQHIHQQQRPNSVHGESTKFAFGWVETDKERYAIPPLPEWETGNATFIPIAYRTHRSGNLADGITQRIWTLHVNGAGETLVKERIYKASRLLCEMSPRSARKFELQSLLNATRQQWATQNVSSQEVKSTAAIKGSDISKGSLALSSERLATRRRLHRLGKWAVQGLRRVHEHLHNPEHRAVSLETGLRLRQALTALHPFVVEAVDGEPITPTLQVGEDKTYFIMPPIKQKGSKGFFVPVAYQVKEDHLSPHSSRQNPMIRREIRIDGRGKARVIEWRGVKDPHESDVVTARPLVSESHDLSEGEARRLIDAATATIVLETRVVMPAPEKRQQEI